MIDHNSLKITTLKKKDTMVGKAVRKKDHK